MKFREYLNEITKGKKFTKSYIKQLKLAKNQVLKDPMGKSLPAKKSFITDMSWGVQVALSDVILFELGYDYSEDLYFAGVDLVYGDKIILKSALSKNMTLDDLVKFVKKQTDL